MDLIDIYRAFHHKEAKYTYFSNTHGSYSDNPHGRIKINFNKFNKIQVISSTFWNHNGLKLETNIKKAHKNIQIHGAK